MSESQNSVLRSSFEEKGGTLKTSAFAVLLLILVGLTIFLIFYTPEILFHFPKHSQVASQPRVRLLESASDSPSCTEPDLEEPLGCVETIKEKLKTAQIDEYQKDFANLFVEKLTNRNRLLYFEGQRRNNIVQSVEDLQERLGRHQQCSINFRLPTLAICAIQRGTSPYIQEWLSFYLIHGVSKFFLYDNSVLNSTENELFRDAVKPFVEAGFVNVRIWSSKGYDQLAAYNDCLDRGKVYYDWLAFFDIDEYLVVNEPGPACLPEFLVGYEEFPALHIKWRTFTPRGVIQHDFSSLFLEQYLWVDPRFIEGKSILQTRFETEVKSPHTFRFKDGKHPVCPDKRICRGWDRSKNPYQYAELRHYWGVDWGFSFFVKLCGGSKEHYEWLELRIFIVLRWLDKDCCVKYEVGTRQAVSLRNFLFN